MVSDWQPNFICSNIPATSYICSRAANCDRAFMVSSAQQQQGKNCLHMPISYFELMENAMMFLVTLDYWFNISQLIRYSRACGSYQDFLDRGLLLTRKLLKQGFLLVKLKSSLQKFYGRHHDFVDRCGISVSEMTTDMFHLS
jgi:hypothetical protein